MYILCVFRYLITVRILLLWILPTFFHHHFDIYSLQVLKNLNPFKLKWFDIAIFCRYYLEERKIQYTEMKEMKLDTQWKYVIISHNLTQHEMHPTSCKMKKRKYKRNTLTCHGFCPYLHVRIYFWCYGNVRMFFLMALLYLKAETSLIPPISFYNH